MTACGAIVNDDQVLYGARTLFAHLKRVIGVRRLRLRDRSPVRSIGRAGAMRAGRMQRQRGGQGDSGASTPTSDEL
jgi:hypothetical protein